MFLLGEVDEARVFDAAYCAVAEDGAVAVVVHCRDGFAGESEDVGSRAPDFDSFRASFPDGY